MSNDSIAFIGLGNMGAPMARNLLTAGYAVQVFDLNAAAIKALAQAGALACTSAEQAVQGAGTVVSMLPASRHVEALYLGRDGQAGLLASIRPGALVLECSTIAPASARKVHAAARERGIALLDAPVSGGTAGAAAGTLTFMAGGRAEDVERARPVLAAMGKNIFHAGPEGAGQVAKVCNNQLLAILMLGSAEALALGVANGLDPAVLSDIMRQSSGGNWVLERYNPWPGVMPGVPAARAYQGGFLTDLMVKDLGLAEDAAQAVHARTPLGDLARSLYREAQAQDLGGLDFSVVQRLFGRTT